MNRRRQVGPRWSKRILKGLVGLVVLLLLGFGFVQLLLKTSWARNKAASELSQRLGGLPVEIGSLGWTPWSGVEIGGLEVAQPEVLRRSLVAPLLKVERIHVAPDYALAWKGDLGIHALRIERPQLHLSVDMLVSIAAAGVDPAPPPPSIAARKPGGESEAPPPVGRPEADAGSTTTAEKPKPSAATEPPPGPSGEPVRKRVRVTVEDGGFELVRAGMGGRLAAMEGVDLDLPLFGDPAETENLLGRIQMMGKTLEEDLALRMVSDGTTVKLLLPQREESDVFGYVALGLKKGVPFQVELGVHLDELEAMEVHPLVSLGSGEFETVIRGVGWMQLPGSWGGRVAFDLKELNGRLGSAPMSFDQATGSLSFARGVLQAPAVRLTGDDGAVLANGWLTANDASAVLRVVIPYPVVGMLNEQFAARIPGGVFPFKPLEPGNRWYSDVALWRSGDHWKAEFGDGGSVVLLGDLLEGE